MPQQQERGEAETRYYIDSVEKIMLEYDAYTDTLYIHFADPSEEAEEAVMTENDIIVRLKNNRILGITIADFSKKIGYQC